MIGEQSLGWEERVPSSCPVDPDPVQAWWKRRATRNPGRAPRYNHCKYEFI